MPKIELEQSHQGVKSEATARYQVLSDEYFALLGQADAINPQAISATTDRAGVRRGIDDLMAIQEQADLLRKKLDDFAQ